MSIKDFVLTTDDKALWQRFKGLVGAQVVRLSVVEDYMPRPSSFSSQFSSETSGSENSFIQDGDLNQLQRNTNALCHVGKQPFLGVEAVSRDVRPLLNFLLSSLHDVTSSNLDGDRCESGKRQKENKRNMRCVYKKSLTLESQLHQYINPNLVTSLNRRAAKAAFEAELMCKMIDKLRKEGRKSVSESESKRKARELTIKLKSLLARQKCEWQCVGRLKETLAMAREMKSVLKFICQLSSLLERLNEGPPPYEDSSPYDDLQIKRDKFYDRHAIVGRECRQGSSRAAKRSLSEVTISLSLDFIPDRKARKPRRAAVEVSVSESECLLIKTASNCRKKKLSKGRSSSLVSMSDHARRHNGRRPSNSACTSPRCARTCTSRGSSPTRHRWPSLKDLSSPIKCKTSSETERRPSTHRHATKCLSVCKCCKIVKELCAGRCKKSKLINNLASSKSHSAKTSRAKKSCVKSSPTLSDIEGSQNLSTSEQETQREPKKRSKTNDKHKKLSATGRYRKESNKCAHRQVSSATPAGSCSKYYMHPRAAVDSSGSREPLLYSSRDTELNFKDDHLSFHYRGPSHQDGGPSSAACEQETSSRQESTKTCEDDSSCTACDVDDIQDSSSSEASEMKCSEPASCTSRYTPEESKDVCEDNSLSFLVKLNEENSRHFSPNSPKKHPLKVEKCRSPPKFSLPLTQSCPTKSDIENGTQTEQDIFLANQMPCPNMIQVSTKWRGTPPGQCCEQPSIETIIKLSMPDSCNQAPQTTQIPKPSSRKSSGYSSRKSVPELAPQSSSESIRELPECPRSPSPECRRSPSPGCKRSDSCTGSPSPIILRSPSPKHSVGTSPIQIKSPSPKHSVGTSPIQIRSPSPNPSVKYASQSPAATQTPKSSSPASRKSPLSPISPVESRQISEKFSKKPSLRSSDPSLTLPTASKMPSNTGSGNRLELLGDESREQLIDDESREQLIDDESGNKEMFLDEPTSSQLSIEQNEIISSHSNTNSVGNNSERDSPIASEKPSPVHTKQSSTTNSPSRPKSSITNSPSRPKSSITNSPSRPPSSITNSPSRLPSSITNSPSRPPSRKNTIRYTPSPVKTPSPSPVKTPSPSPVKTPSPSPSKTPPKKARASSEKKKMRSPREESSEDSEEMDPSRETSRTASPERSSRVEELTEEPQAIPPPPPQQTWQNSLREGWTSWWKLILLILLIIFVLHFLYCYLVAASCRNCRLPGPNILFYFLSWAMNSVRVIHNQPPPQ
ncbi:serine/arginine repetitive matrix protein 1-like isoform X2 [Physella acuta]|uniref:serine/arginine repetitive matrix protein 1-like isoform X2 n=1 Tax=Physella acuta TaxID=109671 RepID=UPI0027DB61E8|nr:serine/arginine repetitive matrix protein 1-like isoform X2 [Physella acuta]